MDRDRPPAKRCLAQKPNGTLCQAWAVRNGSGRCCRHGGLAPRGIAHWNYKDGSRSKYARLPARLGEHYAHALEDPELLSMRHEIALLDARLQQTFEQLSRTNENDSSWELLGQQWNRFLRAREKKDVMAMEACLVGMEHAMQGGVTQAHLWDSAVRLMRDRRALVDSEHKRLMEKHHTLTTERAMALMALVVGVLRTHIMDPRLLRVISTELQDLAIQSFPLVKGGRQRAAAS